MPVSGGTAGWVGGGWKSASSIAGLRYSPGQQLIDGVDVLPFRLSYSGKRF